MSEMSEWEWCAVGTTFGDCPPKSWTLLGERASTVSVLGAAGGAALVQFDDRVRLVGGCAQAWPALDGTECDGALGGAALCVVERGRLAVRVCIRALELDWHREEFSSPVRACAVGESHCVVVLEGNMYNIN